MSCGKRIARDLYSQSGGLSGVSAGALQKGAPANIRKRKVADNFTRSMKGISW